MQRNGTICALSDALVVVEAASKGGTMEAGKRGLELGIPVLAAQYSDDHDVAVGNSKLLELGALRLGKSRETGRANLGRVLDSAQNRRRRDPSLF